MLDNSESNQQNIVDISKAEGTIEEIQPLKEGLYELFVQTSYGVVPVVTSEAFNINEGVWVEYAADFHNRARRDWINNQHLLSKEDIGNVSYAASRVLKCKEVDNSLFKLRVEVSHDSSFLLNFPYPKTFEIMTDFSAKNGEVIWVEYIVTNSLMLSDHSLAAREREKQIDSDFDNFPLNSPVRALPSANSLKYHCPRCGNLTERPWNHLSYCIHCGQTLLYEERLYIKLFNNINEECAYYDELDGKAGSKDSRTIKRINAFCF